MGVLVLVLFTPLSSLNTPCFSSLIHFLLGITKVHLMLSKYKEATSDFDFFIKHYPQFEEQIPHLEVSILRTQLNEGFNLSELKDLFYTMEPKDTFEDLSGSQRRTEKIVELVDYFIRRKSFYKLVYQSCELRSANSQKWIEVFRHKKVFAPKIEKFSDFAPFRIHKSDVQDEELQDLFREDRIDSILGG